MFFLYIGGVEYDEMYYHSHPLKKQFCGNLLIRLSSSSFDTVDGDKTRAEVMMMLWGFSKRILILFQVIVHVVFLERGL